MWQYDSMILGFLIFAKLLLYGLCVYRLALLFSSDIGPWAVFQKLRSWLKREAKHNKPLRDSKLHIGVACIRCESVWLAFPIAAYATVRHRLADWAVITVDVLILALAMSAIAILLHRAFPPR